MSVEEYLEFERNSPIKHEYVGDERDLTGEGRFPVPGPESAGLSLGDVYAGL